MDTFLPMSNSRHLTPNVGDTDQKLSPRPLTGQLSNVSVLGELEFDAGKMFSRYRNSRDTTASIPNLPATAATTLSSSSSGHLAESSSKSHDSVLDSTSELLAAHERQRFNEDRDADSRRVTQAKARKRSSTSLLDRWSLFQKTTSSAISTSFVSTAGSSTVPSSRESPQRKRSSTTSVTTPQLAAHQQILVNKSFFKPAEGDSDRPVTIVTREMDWTEDDWIPAADEIRPPLTMAGQGMSSTLNGSRHHQKANTVTFELGHRTDGALMDSESIRRSSQPGAIVRSKRITISEGLGPKEISIVGRDRHQSIAAFITSPQSNEIRKQAMARLRLDSLKVPSRWISLRNVLSFFNVLILAFSILVVVLVSYFSGLSSTQRAIAALSDVTIAQIQFKLDDMLNNAEEINVFTQSVFITPEYPITNSMRSIRHIYNIMADMPNPVDQVYAVDPDSTYLGVALSRNPYTAVINESELWVKFLNRTTRTKRLVVPIPDWCDYNTTTCALEAFTSRPLSSNTYNVIQRPFYRQATFLQRVGWSSVYLYSDNITYGLTAFRPSWSMAGVFQFVSAVDISLDTLCDYLEEIAGVISGSSLLFIVEPRTGYLMATSRPDRIPVVDPASGQRIQAILSSSQEIQMTLSNLYGLLGVNLDIRYWPGDQNSLVYQAPNAYIIVGRYSRSMEDVDWLVVACTPFSAYDGELLAAHSIQIPIVAVIVLVISVLCSVLITRAIGKPLKRIAEQMLLVADLNFNEDTDEDGETMDKGGHLAQLSVQQPGPLKNLDMNKSISSQLRNSWSAFTSRARTLCAPKNNPFRNLKEVQYLECAMSAMRTGLKSFSKYVPLDIVALLVKMNREAVLGVDDVDLTIFFSDIVNFTTIAEQVTPQQLVEMMSEYLSAMSDIIIANQGTLDKYIGDAIMAFWNAPIGVKDHANIACSVALKYQLRLAELRQGWLQKGYPDIRARIGLNTGNALVGNLGSTYRLNYTCLGDSVNLASRLEGLNKLYDTSILISEFTANRIHRDYFVIRPLDVVAVKGKSKPVLVYELVGFRKLTSQTNLSLMSIYEKSFHEMLRGNYIRAMEGYEIFLDSQVIRNDKATQRHIELCRRLMKRPPPPDWTYCRYLDEK